MSDDHEPRMPIFPGEWLDPEPRGIDYQLEELRKAESKLVDTLNKLWVVQEKLRKMRKLRG